MNFHSKFTENNKKGEEWKERGNFKQNKMRQSPARTVKKSK